MKRYMVSYDLVSKRDYASLYKMLYSLGARRTLESQWVLRSSSSAQELYNTLNLYIDHDDRMLVTSLDSYEWWGRNYLFDIQDL